MSGARGAPGFRHLSSISPMITKCYLRPSVAKCKPQCDGNSYLSVGTQPKNLLRAKKVRDKIGATRDPEIDDSGFSCRFAAVPSNAVTHS